MRVLDAELGLSWGLNLLGFGVCVFHSCKAAPATTGVSRMGGFCTFSTQHGPIPNKTLKPLITAVQYGILDTSCEVAKIASSSGSAEILGKVCGRHQSSQAQRWNSSEPYTLNVGALIIRMGFGGILYYD